MAGFMSVLFSFFLVSSKWEKCRMLIIITEVYETPRPFYYHRRPWEWNFSCSTGPEKRSIPSCWEWQSQWVCILPNRSQIRMPTLINAPQVVFLVSDSFESINYMISTEYEYERDGLVRVLAIMINMFTVMLHTTRNSAHSLASFNVTMSELKNCT